MEILSAGLLVTEVAGCAFLLHEGKIKLTSKEQAQNRLVNEEMVITWISSCKITPAGNIHMLTAGENKSSGIVD